MEAAMTDLRSKTRMISFGILLVSAVLSIILYFMFHIVFIFLIFIPSVIYYLLTTKDNNGTKEM